MPKNKPKVILGDPVSIKKHDYPNLDGLLQIIREFDDAACELREADIEAAAANDRWLKAQERYGEVLERVREIVKKPPPEYTYKVVGVYNKPKE